MDYLHEYRISVARNLKCDENMGLADIARSVGYSNYDMFVMHFKRCVGVTPKEYYKKK